MTEAREFEFTPAAISEVDALLLESRQYQIEEICRVFSGRPIGPAAPPQSEDVA